MTNLQEDLTLALQRRAEAVTVENHLDAILDDHNIIRFSNNNSADPRRNRVLLVAASVAVIVGAGGLIWATNARTQPPAASSTAPAPVDTNPGTPAVSTPSAAATIPAEFPSEVPRPDTFDRMTFITTDNAPVGWEFYDKREPTDSVERCTQYASSFDASWTSTPKTDEHESVLYAQIFDNGQWQVGIFCINDGGHLVQVMPTNATLPPTADTLPPTSTQTQAPPLAAAVVAILHTPDQQTAADALTEALRARGVNVELIAESTRSFQQTRLMPVSGESNPASLALDDLIGLGGLDTWSPDLAAAPVPANVTDVIILGQDGRPTLPLS